MLYPSHETFALSFAAGGEVDNGAIGTVVLENLGDDHIIGVCGPVDDGVLNKIYAAVDKIFDTKMDV